MSPNMCAASDCIQHLWMKGRVCSTLFKKCPDNTKTNKGAITILNAGMHLGLFVKGDVVCCLVCGNCVSLHFVLVGGQTYTTRLFTELCQGVLQVPSVCVHQLDVVNIHHHHDPCPLYLFHEIDGADCKESHNRKP